ncbi:5'-3' exonuclease [Phycicoccus sonneratiae]|uniref:5'-3' exonuclease n=1 Tax=Phycicoccus sonneratiae TaxID=2807628 RepID=A0ABS2CIF7_9MICO|nr:5'-3' exonuclease [Phycicoccus sonneraticus]MBM6399646.1 5'-3' exonuclease [Phycicoccus sonneraticus]
MPLDPDRPRKLLLLDSASLYFRAFFGVPDQRKDPSEPPTNALRGFLDMIATLVTAHRPTHLVACWDDDWRPQWRVDLVPTYKTHRLTEGSDVVEESPDDLSPQVPLIREALAAVGIARLGVADHEADDVIGTLATRHHGVMPVDVVTGDRDLLQLVDDAHDVRVLYTGKGGVREPDVATQALLQEKYGVPTGEAYLEMSVLRGDTSDGLPGVKGIGDKTAAQLIAQYGSLAALREAVDSGDPAIKGARRTNLEAASAYLDVAPTVVRVVRDARVADVDVALPTAVADRLALDELAARYGIENPVGRLLTALGLD